MKLSSATNIVLTAVLVAGGASAETKRLRTHTVYKSGPSGSTARNNNNGNVDNTESKADEHRNLQDSFSLSVSPELNPVPVLITSMSAQAEENADSTTALDDLGEPADVTIVAVDINVVNVADGEVNEVISANVTDISTEAVAATTIAAVEQSCPEFLDKLEIIDNITTMTYALVPSSPAGANNGLLCAQIAVLNEGWVGFGISQDGKMLGSQAVIGLPDAGTVLKYDLSNNNNSRITVMDDSKQTLRETSIIQNLFGVTTLSFAKLLVEQDEISILEEGANNFLYARGSSNEPGYHEARGDFTKVFSQDTAIQLPILPLGPGPELYDPYLGMSSMSLTMEPTASTETSSTPSVSPTAVKVESTANPSASLSGSPTATKTSSPTTASPTVTTTTLAPVEPALISDMSLSMPMSLSMSMPMKTTSLPTNSPETVRTTDPPTSLVDMSMSMPMSLSMSMPMKTTSSPTNSPETVRTTDPTPTSLVDMSMSMPMSLSMSMPMKTTSSPTNSPETVRTTYPTLMSLVDMSMSMSMSLSMSMAISTTKPSSDLTISTSSPTNSSPGYLGEAGLTVSPTARPTTPTPPAPSASRNPESPSSALTISLSFLVASIAAIAGVHLM